MTAKEYFEEEMSGEPLTQDSVIEGLQRFCKLHMEKAIEHGLWLFDDFDREYNYDGQRKTNNRKRENKE